MIALIVATYGVNRFIIMTTHGDTNFNEHSIKNGLSEEEFK